MTEEYIKLLENYPSYKDLYDQDLEKFKCFTSELAAELKKITLAELRSKL
jgi:hypothetical protein